MSSYKAKWWEPAADSAVKCRLCPRGCLIPVGSEGYCGVRRNSGGELFSLAYGRPVAIHIDPIEKKPIVEFLPGSCSFSLGTYGCNLGCSFCQNYHLSRGSYGIPGAEDFIEPEAIVKAAIQKNCKSVSFTYNEPTIWAEYMMDIARDARKNKLATVCVTNGYITLEAAKDVYPLIDAANIDMKGFSEDFYSKMCGGHLKPVLDAMKYYHGIGGHLEITNLVIPGKNDSGEMIDAFLDWVGKELDKNVPLHFSAYHPDYKYKESPATPPKTLHAIRDKANKAGFKHVYLGNIF